MHLPIYPLIRYAAGNSLTNAPQIIRRARRKHGLNVPQAVNPTTGFLGFAPLDGTHTAPA